MYLGDPLLRHWYKHCVFAIIVTFLFSICWVSKWNWMSVSMSQRGTRWDSFKMNGSNRGESIANCLYVPFKFISIIAWRNSMSSLWWLSGKIYRMHFGQYRFLAFAASSRVSLTQLIWFRCLQLIHVIWAPTCWTFLVQTEHLLVRSMIFVFKSIFHRLLPGGLCIFNMG